MSAKRATEDVDMPAGIGAAAIELYRTRYRAAAGAVRSSVELIDVDKARLCLSKNAGNRPISLMACRRYAQAYLRGEWQVNGEAIVLDETGRLLDGQHRLTAVLLAHRKQPGIAVPFVVIRGVQEQAFATIDSGRKRQTCDSLSIVGEAHPKLLAATLRLLHYYRMTGGMDYGVTSMPTTIEMMEVLSREPDVRESVAFIGSRNPVGLTQFPGSVFAFLRHVCTRDRRERAVFFEQVVTGANLPVGSPALAMRDRLTKGERGARLHPMTVMALAIKAWNAYVVGKTFASPAALRFRPEEQFPKIL